MFDISTISKRYFAIRITGLREDRTEYSLALEVAPAKLKTLNKLVSVGKAAPEDSMGELTEAIRELLSNNKAGYNVPEEVTAAMDLDQMEQIITAYFEWLSKAKNSPN